MHFVSSHPVILVTPAPINDALSHLCGHYGAVWCGLRLLLAGPAPTACLWCPQGQNTLTCAGRPLCGSHVPRMKATVRRGSGGPTCSLSSPSLQLPRPRGPPLSGSGISRTGCQTQRAVGVRPAAMGGLRAESGEQGGANASILGLVSARWLCERQGRGEGGGGVL